MKKTMVIAVALATIVCASGAWSQGRGPGGPGGPGGMGRPAASCPATALMPPSAATFDRMVEPLQLTDDQSAKLKNVTAKGDKDISSLTKKAAESSKALRAAVLSSDFDVARVKTLAATAQKAEAAIVSASIDEWAEIRSILNPDQARQLQGMMDEQHPGGGQPPMGPPPAGGPEPPYAPQQ